MTEQGEKALSLPPDEFVRIARAKYAESRDTQTLSASAPRDDDDLLEDADTDDIARQTTYEQAKDRAREQIESAVFDLDAYEFQKLVAELLRAMSYHVPFVAPPGPDGGIDIIAYKDPLGTTTPRIRAQIKHRATNKVNVAEVRALEGVLRKEGDMGLIVSSGGFTADAEREIQVSSKHIEAMDLDRVISLWQQHYDLIGNRERRCFRWCGFTFWPRPRSKRSGPRAAAGVPLFLNSADRYRRASIAPAGAPD